MKIGEHGQIAIPKKIREKYGLMPFIEVEFIPEDTGHSNCDSGSWRRLQGRKLPFSARGEPDTR